MELAIVILGLGLGACIGLMLADMRQRHDAMTEIDRGAEDARKLVAGLQETHNNLVTQTKNLADRVGAVEFVVRSGATSNNRQVFK